MKTGVGLDMDYVTPILKQMGIMSPHNRYFLNIVPYIDKKRIIRVADNSLNQILTGIGLRLFYIMSLYEFQSSAKIQFLTLFWLHSVLQPSMLRGQNRENVSLYYCQGCYLINKYLVRLIQASICMISTTDCPGTKNGSSHLAYQVTSFYGALSYNFWVD